MVCDSRAAACKNTWAWCVTHVLLGMVCDSRAAAGNKTCMSGEVYDGEWKDDKRNGKGEERGGEREQQGGGRRGAGPGRVGCGRRVACLVWDAIGETEI